MEPILLFGYTNRAIVEHSDVAFGLSVVAMKNKLIDGRKGVGDHAVKVMKYSYDDTLYLVITN